MRTITVLAAVSMVAAAQAAVNLEWRIENPNPQVGETVRVGLYAVADGGQSQDIRAMQVIVFWDAEYLHFEGIDNNGPYPWMFSGFPDDAGLDGLNVSFEDGNAYYHAQAQFGNPALATPEGLLVTTFKFKALAATSGANVWIEPTYGQHSVTAVLGGQVPGMNIVGQLGSVTVVIGGGGGWAVGDMNCDGAVDFGDINPFILALTDPNSYYAAFPHCDIMNGDINGDGRVDFADINPFIALLTGW